MPVGPGEVQGVFALLGFKQVGGHIVHLAGLRGREHAAPVVHVDFQPRAVPLGEAAHQLHVKAGNGFALIEGVGLRQPRGTHPDDGLGVFRQVDVGHGVIPLVYPAHLHVRQHALFLHLVQEAVDSLLGVGERGLEADAHRDVAHPNLAVAVEPQPLAVGGHVALVGGLGYGVGGGLAGGYRQEAVGDVVDVDKVGLGIGGLGGGLGHGGGLHRDGQAGGIQVDVSVAGGDVFISAYQHRTAHVMGDGEVHLLLALRGDGEAAGGHVHFPGLNEVDQGRKVGAGKLYPHVQPVRDDHQQLHFVSCRVAVTADVVHGHGCGVIGIFQGTACTVLQLVRIPVDNHELLVARAPLALQVGQHPFFVQLGDDLREAAGEGAALLQGEAIAVLGQNFREDGELALILGHGHHGHGQVQGHRVHVALAQRFQLGGDIVVALNLHLAHGFSQNAVQHRAREDGDVLPHKVGNLDILADFFRLRSAPAVNQRQRQQH